MPDDDPLIDPYLRRKLILDDLGIDGSTLHDWITSGFFPLPEILNEGSAREIPAWRTSTYRQWKDNRPKRLPKPVSANSYSPAAKDKARRTRAERQAAKTGSAPEPAPQPAVTRLRRPRS